MGSGEKKVAALLAVALVVLVAVYFTQKAKPQQPAWSVGGETAAQTGGAAQGQTQEFGEPGAPLEITALVPVVNPCHANTVAALKEVYNAHPDDIHMTIIDFFGPEAGTWKEKLGVSCATVSINGNHTFQVGGRTVTFQKMEGGTYKPQDLRPAIEAELEKVKAAG